MTGVNTLFNALLHAPGFKDLDFSALRVCMGGGMAVQREVATRWQEVTGVPIAQGYGLTEASPIVSGNPLDIKEFNGSVGCRSRPQRSRSATTPATRCHTSRSVRFAYGVRS